MPRGDRAIRIEKEASDSLLIVTCLVIFFFIFQWLEIYSVVTVMQCSKISEFWLGTTQDGFNPFTASIAIFSLILIWSVVDASRAIYLNYSDKVVSIVVCATIVLCSIYTARSLWAQWEYFEISWGVLEPENSIFLNVEKSRLARFSRHDAWQDFLHNKRCQDPFRSLNIDSESDWKKLEQEFVSQGGALPWVQYGN